MLPQVCRQVYNLVSISSGVRSIAVPGELRGYWEAKRLYGNKDVSWASLLQPSIKMCRDGIVVNFHLASAIKKTRDVILKDAGLRQVDGVQTLERV